MLSDEPESTVGNVNQLVVVGGTITLILLGLGVTVVTMFLPTLFVMLLVTPTPLARPYWVAVGIVQLIHLRQLWKNPKHLAFYRWLSLPIRRWLLPIVILTCRLDSIREKEPTMYFPTEDLKIDAIEGNEKDALLLTFRSSIRRRHRHMEQLFVTSGTERKSIYSESDFNPSLLMPIMWRHIQAQCNDDGKNFLVEFIKRFLVMTMVPDAILDVYYQETSYSRPVAVQMSILQGQCIHSFMYFSTEHGSGIWFQGVLLSMARGVQLPGVKYVNGQTHHESSKRNAGFLVAYPNEHEFLLDLYPWEYTEKIPKAVLLNSPWEDNLAT